LRHFPFNILSPKGMCSESRDLFTFWKIKW